VAALPHGKKTASQLRGGGLDVSRVNTLLTAELPIEYLWSTVEIPLTDTKTFSRFTEWRDALQQKPGQASPTDSKTSKHDSRFARISESLGEEEQGRLGCLVIPLATPLQFQILDGRHRATMSYFSPINEAKRIHAHILIRRKDLKKYKRWRRYRPNVTP